MAPLIITLGLQLLTEQSGLYQSVRTRPSLWSRLPFCTPLWGFTSSLLAKVVDGQGQEVHRKRMRPAISGRSQCLPCHSESTVVMPTTYLWSTAVFSHTSTSVHCSTLLWRDVPMWRYENRSSRVLKLCCLHLLKPFMKTEHGDSRGKDILLILTHSLSGSSTSLYYGPVMMTVERLRNTQASTCHNLLFIQCFNFPSFIELQFSVYYSYTSGTSEFHVAKSCLCLWTDKHRLNLYNHSLFQGKATQVF